MALFEIRHNGKLVVQQADDPDRPDWSAEEHCKKLAEAMGLEGEVTVAPARDFELHAGPDDSIIDTFDTLEEAMQWWTHYATEAHPSGKPRFALAEVRKAGEILHLKPLEAQEAQGEQVTIGELDDPDPPKASLHEA